MSTDRAGGAESRVPRFEDLAGEDQRRLLALVARETANMVIITNPEGLIEWVNQGFETLSGYALAEARGRKPGELLQGPETDRATAARIGSAVRERRSIRTEILNYTRAGRPYWIEIHVEPVFDDSGRLQHFIAIELDITERKRMVDEIRAAKTRAEDKVREQVAEIADSQMATIFALARLAESRDPDTGRHLERVQQFCRLIAVALAGRMAGLDLPEPDLAANVFLASPLHDIGKVGVPDAILLKPGPLTTEEMAAMRRHPLIGAETLRAVLDRYPRNGFIRTGMEIARSHHERWDGGGYPDGLAGPAIPLSARIMAVADAYDAIRSRRCYKGPVSHDETCRRLRRDRGLHFDPAVIDAFDAVHEEFRRTRDSFPD